jgi:hypothetical protein
MTIPEDLKLKVGGFSGKRVVYVLAFASLALIPAHFYISCQASGAVAGIGVIVLLLTGVLSFIVPSSTPHRFRPLAFAVLASFGHMLFTH